MGKLAKTRYPGIYKRKTKSGYVYDVCATYRGQQKWDCGKLDLEEAKEAKANLVRALREGTVGRAPIRLTVAEFIIKQWLPYKATTRPASYRTYSAMAKHIIRDLGGMRLTALRHGECQAFVTGLHTQRGMAPKSCKVALAALHDALSMAVKWELIPRNPCDGVETPKGPDRQIPDVTPEFLAAILSVTRGSPVELETATAIETGMRIKEIVGLEWAAVDLYNRVLSVRRGTTKSEAGRRIILISEALCQRLNAHRCRQIEKFGELPSVVFRPPKGWSMDTFRQTWRGLVAGHPLLNGLHFHDLRHVNATLMAQLGAHPAVMQRRLGHSAAGVSLNVYTHAQVADQQVVADQLGLKILGLNT